MHICVLFYNLGGYHLARLNAAQAACQQRGWGFDAVQIVETTAEHPWGKIALPDYVTTLLPFQEGGDPKLPNQQLLVDMLNRINPDVIAIPGWGFDFARTALNWCSRHGRVTILMSESKYDDAPRVWWKELAKRLLSVRHFDAGLVGGEKHRDYLRRLGMPDDRIFEGYDVVDNQYFIDGVEHFRNLRRAGDVNPLMDSFPAKTLQHALALQPTCVRSRKYFVAVNRFIPRKNIAALIAAFHQFAQARSANDEWDLVLLGDGTQKDELVQIAQQTGLSDRIHFPGFQSYSEIFRWYAFADVFVHPALAEQWGLVVNEAMASGLPILLSRACGCYPDLIEEGVSGLSFDPTDVVELAEKMTELANDESLRQRMGLAARERIQRHFTPAKFGEGLMAAIDAAQTVKSRVGDTGNIVHRQSVSGNDSKT